MAAVFTGEVHPVADLFPMLADDELQDLAEDIKANGLLQPLVLDADGRLLDGRNRLAACKLVEVEPEFIVYDGPDPAAYALSVNIARRHLTKGQRAMLLVAANGYTEYTEDDAEAQNLSKQYVSRARVVARYAPDLVPSVIAGVALNEAYDTAQRRKKAADSDESKMAKLRAQAPDLADLVVEERMTLAEAFAVWEQRETEQEQRIRSALDGTSDALVRLASILGPDGGIDRVADNWQPDTTKAWQVEPNRPLLSADGMRQVAGLLNDLALTLEKSA